MEEIISLLIAAHRRQLSIAEPLHHFVVFIHQINSVTVDSNQHLILRKIGARVLVGFKKSKLSNGEGKSILQSRSDWP